jgi:hypothetical protein
VEARLVTDNVVSVTGSPTTHWTGAAIAYLSSARLA